jgi:hypothetical protein
MSTPQTIPLQQNETTPVSNSTMNSTAKAEVASQLKDAVSSYNFIASMLPIISLLTVVIIVLWFVFSRRTYYGGMM